MSETACWTVLFVADIVGTAGLNTVKRLLPELKEKHAPDLIIANGENGATNGRGLSKKVAQAYFELGIDVISSGNHIWENAEIYDLWRNKEYRILRPANYPHPNPGRGYLTVELPDGQAATIINLQGRTFMYAIDCPFKAADDILQRAGQASAICLLDFHAEATAEKMAMGWHLDGRICAVIGTHTHVPTADERILPQGTAYITDAGMTGSFDSVIGMRKETAIKRFVRQTPMKLEPSSANAHLCGVIIQIDKASRKAKSIDRIFIK